MINDYYFLHTADQEDFKLKFRNPFAAREAFSHCLEPPLAAADLQIYFIKMVPIHHVI
jgi:hypothetical protein